MKTSETPTIAQMRAAALKSFDDANPGNYYCQEEWRKMIDALIEKVMNDERARATTECAERVNVLQREKAAAEAVAEARARTCENYAAENEKLHHDLQGAMHSISKLDLALCFKESDLTTLRAELAAMQERLPELVKIAAYHERQWKCGAEPVDPTAIITEWQQGAATAQATSEVEE